MSTPQEPQSSPPSVRVEPKGGSGAPAGQSAPVSGASAPGASAAGGPASAPPATTQPRHEGPGVVRRTARTTKQILLVVLGALIAIFAIVNSQDVDVDWIFGSPIQVPLILVIAVVLLIGLAIGWISAKLSSRQSD